MGHPWHVYKCLTLGDCTTRPAYSIPIVRAIAPVRRAWSKAVTSHMQRSVRVDEPPLRQAHLCRNTTSGSTPDPLRLSPRRTIGPPQTPPFRESVA